MRLLIEVPVGTPERLQVTGLFPVSPEGHTYLPPTHPLYHLRPGLGGADGGWEAPVWAQARRVLACSHGRVPVTDHEVEELPDDDQAGN